MGVAKNAMEIFKVLDKSNCRLCGEKTCLAFAGAVFCKTRRIWECPKLSAETRARFGGEGGEGANSASELEAYIATLKNEVMKLDFSAAARRIGAQVQGGVLQLRVLGKLFGVRKDGSFATDLHLTPWVVIPLLDYILNCKGAPVAGDWLSYRELPGGQEKYPLFKKRGEDVLQQLASKYTDFFSDIVQMFDGRAVEKQFLSDVSVVLYPFPLVPMMICYWQPDEGLDASLNIFFDKSAGENIGVDSAFSLGTGLVRMFEKLATHHGF